MKKSKVLENLKSLYDDLRGSYVSECGELCTLAKIIRKMEKQQEGKYTVIFAYPEEQTDGKLQTCVEFVLAGSVDEALLRSGRPEGSTVIAVFKGYRKCLYSEA